MTNEQADDAVQGILVRLLDQLRDGTTVLNPKAWAYRSVCRLAMDRHLLGRRPARAGEY
jgi:DNA-directed RNA polymerase specialized sigma24 family protein